MYLSHLMFNAWRSRETQWAMAIRQSHTLHLPVVKAAYRVLVFFATSGAAA
jgi:hypothetical protein